MTTVATSRKIVTSIMTLELLESTELDYIDFCCIYGGRSRISGNWVHMYKGAGFAFLILSHFYNYHMKMKQFSLTESKLFHRIFKN